MTLGLYIGRLNPPHIGHIQTIEKALKENEKVLVLLGSPIVKNKSNPLDFEKRKILLEKIFKDKIVILEIKDSKSDLSWVYNIYKLIYYNYFGSKKINFYGGDFKNDSAYLVIKKYQDIIVNFDINYLENSRKNSFVEYKGKKYEISATNLRETLEKEKYDLAKRFCYNDIFEEIKKMFK